MYFIVSLRVYVCDYDRASVSGLSRPFLSFGFYPLNLHSFFIQSLAITGGSVPFSAIAASTHWVDWKVKVEFGKTRLRHIAGKRRSKDTLPISVLGAWRRCALCRVMLIYNWLSSSCSTKVVGATSREGLAWLSSYTNSRSLCSTIARRRSYIAVLVRTALDARLSWLTTGWPLLVT